MMEERRGDPDTGGTRHHRALHAVAEHIRPGSFPFLLAAMLVNYLLNGIASPTTAGSSLVLLGHVAVFAAGLYVLSENRLTVAVGSVLLAAYLAIASGVVRQAPAVDRVLMDSFATGYLLWILAVVLREVFRPTTSERDAVIGALTGFLLILSGFMRMHGLIEALAPGSYRADPPLPERPGVDLVAVFQYFSTITLTTVGYGDIVPVTPAARLVTGLQSITGQIYLAVVVATLVSRVAARRD